MTTKLDAIRQREQAATRTLNGLCDGSIRWAMRVPAEPDRDPDLVIGASLADVPLLLAAVKATMAMVDINPVVPQADGSVFWCLWCSGGGDNGEHEDDCPWLMARVALAPLLEPEG